MLVVTTALVDAIKRWRESALDSLDEFGDTSTDDDDDEDFNFVKTLHLYQALPGWHLSCS